MLFVVVEAGSLESDAGSLYSDQCIFERFIALFSHRCVLTSFGGKK